MTDLERRALLGDRQAQEECTEKGIMLPCPFCGGKPQLKYNYVAQKKKQWSVQCRCGARFFFVDRRYKAIEAWNRRAGEEDKHEAD